MKEESREAVKHELPHETPTVIHNPEEDLTILAKWLRRGIEQGPRFWFLVAGVVAVFAIITTLLSGLSGGRSATGRAWTELALATTPGQRVEIADEFPKSEVALAARLQAASNYFNDAVRGLPNEREKAGPELRKALDLFDLIAKEAPKDSSEALAANFGAARTLEARNELSDAVLRYKAVISGWPGTPEAKQAEKLVTQLEDPDVIAFYKQLYSYTPPTSPGIGGLPKDPNGLPAGLGGLPAGHPALNGPTVPTGPISVLPPLPGFSDTPAGPGPLDIAPPPDLPGPAKPIGKDKMPKAIESPKPAEIKPAAPVAKPELPVDPFKPAAKP